MIYQRYTTAVKRAYRGDQDVDSHHARATEFREWLEGLVIEPAVRADLVEQARAIEHGFEELAHAPAGSG